MVDLPHTFAGYIQQEETQFTAAVSEYTMQKIGQNINALADSLNYKVVSFNTPGSTSWIVPDTVTSVFIRAVGGGGGGGGGGFNPGNPRIAGASGGVGSDLVFSRMSGLTPGGTIPIVIGAGGASCAAGVSGNNGGDTTFNGVVVAAGGLAGVTSGTPNIAGKSQLHRPDQTRAGDGSGDDNGGAGPGYPSRQYSGGSPGTGLYAGGGGGAGAFGPGGNGGNNSVAGSSASSTSYGAGGGGGGGFAGGGAGAGGYLEIIYWD